MWCFVHVQTVENALDFRSTWSQDIPGTCACDKTSLEAGLAARAARQAETKILMVSNQVKTSNKEEDSDFNLWSIWFAIYKCHGFQKNPLGSTKVYPFWPGAVPTSSVRTTFHQAKHLKESGFSQSTFFCNQLATACSRSWTWKNSEKHMFRQNKSYMSTDMPLCQMTCQRTQRRHLGGPVCSKSSNSRFERINNCQMMDHAKKNGVVIPTCYCFLVLTL